MRFIRKNGRVIPINDGGSHASAQKSRAGVGAALGAGYVAASRLGKTLKVQAMLSLAKGLRPTDKTLHSITLRPSFVASHIGGGIIKGALVGGVIGSLMRKQKAEKP